jgi:predicted phage baseplate assembly protein
MPSTWPLARVTTNDTIDDIPPGPDQPSVVVRGNIVPVDHGESSGLDEAFPIVKPGRRRAIVPLSRANVTQALAHDVSAPAATVLQSEPDKTAPVIAVTQDSGDASADGWSVVLDLLDADDTSRALVLDVEADGSAQLRSGDGELGRVPDPSVAMAIRYRVGNGPEGNVGAEAIRHLLTDGYVGLDGSFKLTFAGSAPDVVRVRNVVEAVGGTHPQSISEARRLAPLQFQDPERAVTPEDYARFAAGHPDVEAAKGIVRWTGSWNAIVLLLDLVGGKLLDDEFEEEIRDFLEPYRLAGHALEFRDPILVPLELEMRVCVEEAMPTDLVEEHLRHLFSSRVLPDGSLGLFHPDLFSFGSEVHLSKLYAAVHATAGVRHAEITEMRRQGDAGPSLALETGLITFGEYEIPILENRRDFPDRGRLSLIMEGGI